MAHEFQLSIVIGAALAGSFTNTLKTAEQRTQELRKKLAKAEAGARVGAALQRYKAQLQELRAAQRRGGESGEALGKEIAAVGVAYRKAAKEAHGYGLGVGEALRGQSAFAAEAERTRRVLQRQEKRNSNREVRSEIHAQLPGLVGAAMSVALPVKNAMEFESAMADVKKVMTFESPEQFKQMGADLLELSTHIAMSAEGFADIAAAAGQSGIARDAVQGFARDAAKMGVAFDMSGMQAGETMANWRAGMGLTQERVVGLADAVNHLSNNMNAKASTAGAQARRLLVRAAAQQWRVDPAQCRAVKGRVEHAGSGRSLGYGELALAAARLEVPAEEVPPESDSYQIIGRSLSRLDANDKITGKAVYGQDVKLPDMLLATVIHPPVFGSGLKSFQNAEQVGVPGLTRVMPVSTGLALVGTSFWSLLQARERIKVQWDSQGMTDLDSEQLFKRWEELAKEKGSAIQDEGDVDQAFASGLDVIQASYLLPYVAHACPEPMNCTARVTRDRCEVWAPTQNQDGTQEVAARICGLGYEAVQVHTPYVGGGFGRRSCVDFVIEAVELSKALGKPVKVLWTREEDVRHDAYRPASYNLLKAGLDKEGRLVAWAHRIVGPDDQGQLVPQLLPSVVPYWVPRGARDLARWLGGKALPLVIPGKGAAQGAAPLDYQVPNVRVEHRQDDPGVPLGFWRSVGHSSNGFVKECFMDEIAHHLGQDPLEFRRPLLKHDPPALAALEDLAKRSAWNGPKGPDGLFRGLALHDFHGCKVACLAEVAPAGRLPDQRCAASCAAWNAAG